MGKAGKEQTFAHKTNTVLGGSRGRKGKGEMLWLYYNLKTNKK